MGEGILVAYLQVSLEIIGAVDARQQFGFIKEFSDVRRVKPLLEFELNSMRDHILPGVFSLSERRSGGTRYRERHSDSS